MKQLVYKKFGGVDVLELIETPIPSVQKNSVLVKVIAAAINPVDWKMREGQLKLLSGRKFPQGSGLEFSGVIEKIGNGVTQFKVGDEVFGAAKSSMADYVAADAKKICKKPSNITHEQASTIPIVGVTALSIFTKIPNIKNGTEVLVNGATGGIGMIATQLAKYRGAYVTAVVSAKGIDLVKKWGVDSVINYKETDVLKSSKTFDVVIELSDKLAFAVGKNLLKEQGFYVASLPSPKEIFSGLVNNLFSKRKYKLVGSFASQSKLEMLANDAQKGILDIVVGKTFSFQDFQEAYMETPKGSFLGKVVFKIQ